MHDNNSPLYFVFLLMKTLKQILAVNDMVCLNCFMSYRIVSYLLLLQIFNNVTVKPLDIRDFCKKYIFEALALFFLKTHLSFKKYASNSEVKMRVSHWFYCVIFRGKSSI